MTPPTPFEQAVIALIKAAPNGILTAARLREALIAQGRGKHPAAVACNLTRVAWRERYFTCFVSSDNIRIFTLTSEGRHLC
jgi:hypothetical protein